MAILDQETGEVVTASAQAGSNEVAARATSHRFARA